MALFGNMNILLVFFLFVGVVVESKDPIVETKDGKISGMTKSDDNGKEVTMFLGIPYARPPVGPLRFMKPEKPLPWDGILETTEFGNVCTQVKEGEGTPDRIMNVTLNTTQSEDCLFINVFVPGNFRKRLNNPRAVMVWIHGGALIRGSTNMYRGDELAVEEDVIVVSMNYRLALLGFLASDDDTVPGNQGFFDQLLALKWINENIAAFGGDLSRITIFGQSAGGNSVLFHLLSPLSVGLFSRVIFLSGALASMRTRQGQYEVIREAAKSKCGIVQDSQALLECLQGLTTDEIVELHDPAFDLGYSMACVDGIFLPEDFKVLLMDGKFNKDVTVMVGYTGHDGDLSIPNSEWVDFLREGVPDIPTAKDMIKESFRFLLQDKSNEEEVNDLLFKKYINCKTDPGEMAEGILDLRTDVLFGTLPFLIADELTRFGVEVYMYRFDHVSSYLQEAWQPIFDLKAGHIQEVVYVFGSGFHPDINDLYTEEERLLSTSIRTGFARFAKHRKVKYTTNDQELVVWKQYISGNKRFVVFNTDMTKDSMQPVPEDVLKRASLWITVIPEVWDIHGCNKRKGKKKIKKNTKKLNDE